MINRPAGSISVRKYTWAGHGDPYERIGLWGWVGLYFTGALLLFFLLAHIFLIHFTPPVTITAQTTALGLQSPLVRFLDLSLLAFAVVHGLLGTRRIILDCEVFRGRGQRWVSAILIILGIFFVASGFIIFRSLASQIA